jgi:hypothetical protein
MLASDESPWTTSVFAFQPSGLGRGLTRLERGFLDQYRALEVFERLAWLQPEFLPQKTARLLKGLERFCLTAGAVEREHELTT